MVTTDSAATTRACTPSCINSPRDSTSEVRRAMTRPEVNRSWNERLSREKCS